ncbi:glutamate--tRNA ligase [Jatrophihabitans sp.]|uniref:glutamate--tRNA ligase n=1 Tax=Jatrophihabitans sp. TaxID=1932789 RepID=UPI0030C6C2DA|nr:glutamyl-tRNA synthetase [Jatrophihabitans sp.]
MTAARPPRLRVAPSPTGDPHVGTAYMSLFNLGFVRRHGGSFVLRIEDTDRARFQADSEQQIYDTLRWLGLTWDEGPDIGGPYEPYRQSERLDTYQPFVERLIADGHAYHCWCSTERLAEMRDKQRMKKLPTGYDRLCLGKTEEERRALGGATDTPVVRMLIPDDAPLTFLDVIRGEVSAPRPDDQVILKADGFPTYHLAVVVDDHLMGITHVVRGEEWISSTPKHVLLYQWLGFEAPQFAHMPLLRNTDKSKISKRKNPAARLTWFVEQGYLPEALINFLALLGYGQPGEEEIFGFEQFSASFDWSRVNTVGPVFDLKKLDWLNGHYIRALSTEELAERLVAFAQLSQPIDDDAAAALRAATPLVQERMETLALGLQMLQFLIIDDADFAVDEIAAVKQLGDEQQPVVAAALAAVEQLATWDSAAIEAALRTALVDGLGLKPRNAFGPVRVAVTGSTISPPLFESLELLGRERTLVRLRAALT